MTRRRPEAAQVTNRTITDEQIRELRRVGASGLTGWSFRVALRDGRTLATERMVRVERARCADAWNARHGGDGQ